MKRILIFFLMLFLTFSLVSAISSDHWMRSLPSFNVKLTPDGSTNIMKDDPSANVILSRGNMVTVILRHLEPESYYSLRHGSDCIDMNSRTNKHGNLRSTKLTWDYSDLYENRNVMLGGDIPTLKEDSSSDFELTEFKCSASTGETILMGVEPKNSIRILTK